MRKINLVIILSIFSLFIGEVKECINEYINDSPPFILDVDMSTDVDDVCAVRIATELHNQGKIDLKAVGYCVGSENNEHISALRGILVNDNCLDVKIGHSPLKIIHTSPYWKEMSKFSDGKNESIDAVKLYRQILATSKKKVSIVTTGYLTNIELLLKSEPDDISPLTGKELLKKKCKQLYITGGAQPEGFDNNFFFGDESINAITYVNDNFPLPIIYFPSNVGGKMLCGVNIQRVDVDRKDPVARALDAWGTVYGRAAWDPFAMWCAGLELNEETQVGLKRINMYINEDGSNKIEENENGKHFAIYILNDDLNYYNSKMDEIVTSGFLRNENK